MKQAIVLRYPLVAAICVATLAGAANQRLDVPFFAQKKNGCGAASVAMVEHYWSGRPAKQSATAPSPEQVYQQLYQPDRRGILLADMKRYLEDHGYRAVTLRGEWVDLERHLSKGRPVIVGLKPGRSKGLHFAVLTGTEGNHVWLNDPTRKRPNRVDQAKFEKQWEFADRWMLLATPASPE
ncbi:MAG TPA: C39 family peptidase [Bryobacteraceae bacterium]|nr:C39 family peptidase [Bryobacteraceae bacterium]